VAAADGCRRLGVAKGPGMPLWPATVEPEGVGGSDMLNRRWAMVGHVVAVKRGHVLGVIGHTLGRLNFNHKGQ
jgi:hypothetical protein